MSINLSALMKQRYDTAANWTGQNPTLLAGEIGIESDTKKWKVGTGSTAWTSLAYAIGGTYPIVNADIAAGAAIAYSKLATLTNGNIVLGSAANVATSTAVTGDVTISNTGVTAIAAGVIIDADINAAAAIAGSKIVAATTAVVGAVQLSNSTSTTSSVLAATPTAVKSAYDLADAALPKAGGTLTGNVILDNQVDARFREATANGTNYVGFQAPASIAADVLWTLPATDGTAAQVLRTDGSGTLSWASDAGGSATYQEFTSSGTWTKPAGVTMVYIEVVSAGAGGGSGRRGAALTARGGGGGGASGTFISRFLPASACGSTETVTVAASATGGAAITANDTNGNPGSAGGSSSFGSLLIAPGSNPGLGGGTGAGGGNGGGATYYGALQIGTGIYSSAGSNGIGSLGGTPTAGLRSGFGPGGGPGGAGITTADVVTNGAAGGQGFAMQKNSAVGTLTTGGGGTAGTSGGAGGAGTTYGDSGGSGASSITTAAGAGGAGAFPGGAGAGGGGSLNGFASGAGGAGAAGYVRVWSW